MWRACFRNGWMVVVLLAQTGCFQTRARGVITSGDVASSSTPTADGSLLSGPDATLSTTADATVTTTCQAPASSCTTDAGCCSGRCVCGKCEAEIPSSLQGSWGRWIIGNATEWVNLHHFHADGRYTQDARTFKYFGGLEGQALWNGRVLTVSPGTIRLVHTHWDVVETLETPYAILDSTTFATQVDAFPAFPWLGKRFLTMQVYHALPTNATWYEGRFQRFDSSDGCDLSEKTLLESSRIRFYFDQLPEKDGELCIFYEIRWRKTSSEALQTKNGQVCASYESSKQASGAYAITLKDLWKAIDESDLWNCTVDAAICQLAYDRVNHHTLLVPADGQQLVAEPRYQELGAEGQVRIGAGSFTMGSDATIGKDDEHPPHQVALSAFWIDKTEVTVGQYKVCRSAGVCTEPTLPGGQEFWESTKDGNNDSLPVQHVSWDQAQSYCLWVGKRLPTEAEWEFAARGTQGRYFPWGDKPDATVKGTPAEIKPVGTTPGDATPSGVFDLGGNVPEWVADHYDAGYYKTSPQTDPPGPAATPGNDGENHVIRGFWPLDGEFRAARRASWYDLMPFSSTFPYAIGFRCAR